MKKEKRFCICGDDSGHEYYIPCGQESDFYKWVESTEDGGDSDLCFDNCRIDGHFTFTDPKCE